MILQALKEYYDRKAADPGSRMAPPGFEWKEIPFVIVLKPDGTPVNIEHETGAKPYLVPQAVKKTINVEANLLWDNPEYVLGVVLKGKKRSAKKTDDDIKKLVSEQHTSFIKRIDGIGDISDSGLQAVKRFLQIENKVSLLRALGDPCDRLLDSGSNVTFKLAGESGLVFERPAVKSAIQVANEKLTEEIITCMVTGQKDCIQLVHPPIRRIFGGKAEANIVSFNLGAFKSFGKDQGANAPVGKTAAFAYTTALNHLLAKDSMQRMQVGDASTVFWAERAHDFEQQLADFFGEPPKDDPDRGFRAVESLFKSIKSGAFLADENEKNRFYVLGLSPNSSRIAIRFWIVDTVAGMAEKIKLHFDDLQIVHGPRDKDVFSLFRLLVSTAAQGKADNIPPNMAGDTMRSILEGLPYPQTLLQSAIRRIRAEHEITYIRAALIKACLNRSTRFKNTSIEEELKMSLDESNTNIGYRLGRLFATLERVQIRKFTQDGGKEPNSTIRDKYYGSASGTPATVFGTLIRLSKHHLASLDNVGERINFEKLIGEIMNDICDFPPHLKLEDQGRFAIGYYHQMQAFYKKKEKQD